MKRYMLLVYGLMCYLAFLAAEAYTVGFTSNIGVTQSLDAVPRLPALQAALANIGLLSLFGLQHSVMARARFKQWWTRYIPKAAERSTYVLASSLLYLAVMALWQPIGGTVWQVESSLGRAVVYGIYALGLVVYIVSTFLINHAAFAGFQQLYQYLTDKRAEVKFRTPLLYRWVRHPMMLGLLVIFWASPTMTAGHLLFAVGMTIYILIGITFEERQLVHEFGSRYEEYRRRTPMLIPALKR